MFDNAVTTPVFRFFSGAPCLSLSPGAPSPPLDVTIPDASRQHINVSWKPPAKDGGCPVTGYHVEVAEARPELKWLRVNSRPVKELSYKIDDGIKPEKKYVIRIRAINSVGVSEPSEISDKVSTKDPDCKYPPLLVGQKKKSCKIPICNKNIS